MEDDSPFRREDRASTPQVQNAAPDPLDYMAAAERWRRAKDAFEDKLCEAGFENFDETWTDSYDLSVEFSKVADDARLTAEQQEIISDAGFARCWLNHDDGFQTYYVWPRPFVSTEGHHYIDARTAAKKAAPVEETEGHVRSEAQPSEPHTP